MKSIWLLYLVLICFIVHLTSYLLHASHSLKGLGLGKGALKSAPSLDKPRSLNTQYFRSRDDLLSDLEALGIMQYLVYRNAAPRSENALPVAVVVHHREFHGGCHTFERFFNPQWETIIVLGEDMAEQYQLKQLAEKAVSPGVHLALLNNSRTGEWLGRQVALKILNRGSSTSPPLMLSAQCDMHPLPEWHAQHKSLEETVSRMVHEFLEEDRLNSQEQTNVNDYTRHDVPPFWKTCTKGFSNKLRPLLVMNTAIVETLPSTDTLMGSEFHGLEIGLKYEWEERFSRPTDLPHDKPWMSDVSTFVEDHFALYNVSLLAEFLDDFAKVDPTISMGIFSIPQVLCKKEWKAVRLNDEPIFFDLAKSQYKSSGQAKSFDLFDPSKYGSVPLDWLFTRSIVYLATVTGPLGCLREYMRLRMFADVHVTPWCGFAFLHLQISHIPTKVWNTRVGENEAIVAALMQLHGYELARRTHESLVFLSILAPHTQPPGTFIETIQEGTNGIISDSFAGNLTLIHVPRNITLKPESFFQGHGLRMNSIYGSTGEMYSHSATHICQLLSASHSWDTEMKQLTMDDVIQTMKPVADICGRGFAWEPAKEFE